jgi:hypothetical protein
MALSFANVIAWFGSTKPLQDSEQCDGEASSSPMAFTHSVGVSS